MKVLIISDAWHPQINGVVRTYEHLCSELEKADYRVEIIGPADFAASIPMPFYPEIKLVIRPFRRLKRLIKDFQPDKVHIATEGPLGWAARKYCIKNDIRFTSCYHTQFPDYVAKRFAWLIPPLYNVVHRIGIRIVRHFHSPSSTLMVATKSLEKQLLEWGFKTEIKPLSRGVETSIFHPNKAQDDTEMFNNIKSPIALYVGRIAIEKNLEAFLDMEWNGSKVMVGDGPTRASLEKRYPDAIFVGKKTREELASYYRAADVFVFPSKTDTFGIVLIEALACGLPVAAYNVIGPKDIITHDYLGALSDTDLGDATQRALAQVDKHKCVQHIKDNYSWEAAGKQFMDAL
ncbi:MAG: glycosyl transferase [Zetaproteobacteria bacterium]|nr:MAG: glycosyl transferase [Zetaproteobacteria bacterium]